MSLLRLSYENTAASVWGAFSLLTHWEWDTQAALWRGSCGEELRTPAKSQMSEWAFSDDLVKESYGETSANIPPPTTSETEIISACCFNKFGGGE